MFTVCRREVRRLAPVDADAGELVEPLDLDVELLAEELAQSGDLERRTEPDDLVERDAAVQLLVVVQRLLHVAQEVGEDRPHRLHDLLGVLAGRGLLLERVGLAVTKLEALADRLGEVRSAEREGADPAPALVGNDEIRRRGADVEEDERLLRLAELQVIGKGVEHRERAQRHDVGVDAEFLIEREPLAEALLRDREDAHLDLGAVGGLHDLVIPLDFLDGERDLLHGLELHDARDLARLDRRELRETGERGVPGDRDHRTLALHALLAHELAQAKTDHLVLVEVRRRQHFLMRNHREIGQPGFVSHALEPDRLDCVRSDFDAPSGVR
jgi:hypothetical protein